MTKTSKQANKERGRDAWLGEGGNPRTDQRQQIVMFDNVIKTRHTLDRHEEEQQARDEKTYAPDGAADRFDPLQQLGRWLEPGLFIAKLRVLNPNLIFEPSPRPGFMCISIEADGLNIKTGQSGRYKRFITSFGMEQPLPEFSVMAPRIEDRPTAEGEIETRMSHAYEQTRGWRTVLAKLCAAGLVPESAITRHFTPELGRSSALWKQQMHAPMAIGGH